jgi:hypothetical protein
VSVSFNTIMDQRRAFLNTSVSVYAAVCGVETIRGPQDSVLNTGSRNPGWLFSEFGDGTELAQVIPGVHTS